jgi:hypothetical protein
MAAGQAARQNRRVMMPSDLELSGLPLSAPRAMNPELEGTPAP